MHGTGRPRFGFSFAAALVLLLYAGFAFSTARLMLAMRASPHDVAMTMTEELPQSDYARFWYAGRRELARYRLAAAPSGAVFPLDILAPATVPLKAWLYPPPMQLLGMGFAWVPLPLSFWLWRAASLLLGAALLRLAGLRWAAIAAGLASPAALHDTLAGQNGTLLGSLLVAALLLAERRPKLAGALAGLLAVKPQLALAVPPAWLRPRFAAAFAMAALAGLAVVALSLVVVGWPAWVQFLGVARRDSAIVVALPFPAFFPAAGITPFYMFRSLGAGLPLARLAQASISVVALVLVWLAWRPAAMQALPRMALTCALGVLAMPYGFSYDLVGFSIAVAALFFAARGAAQLVLAALWLLGGYTITIADDTGLLLFPLWAVCGAGLAWNLRALPDAR